MQASTQSSMNIARVSACVIALRMTVLNNRKKEIGLVLIGAYAPIGIAPEEERSSFFNNFDTAVQLYKPNGITFIGMVGNSSLGTGDGKVCGPFGLYYANSSGKCMHSYISKKSISNNHFLPKAILLHLDPSSFQAPTSI
eukprot:9611489-Ditylum_brightwellii.AAC.1